MWSWLLGGLGVLGVRWVLGVGGGEEEWPGWTAGERKCGRAGRGTAEPLGGRKSSGRLFFLGSIETLGRKGHFHDVLYHTYCEVREQGLSAWGAVTSSSR